MKHQISKVALMATLAFIGAGFAGTQQAKAADCPSDDCNFGEDLITPCQIPDLKDVLGGAMVGYSIPVVVRSSGQIVAERNLGCFDCDGDCYDDGRFWAVVKEFDCHAANAQGEVFSIPDIDSETGLPVTDPDTGDVIRTPLVLGSQTEASISMGLCEIDLFPDPTTPTPI